MASTARQEVTGASRPRRRDRLRPLGREWIGIIAALLVLLTPVGLAVAAAPLAVVPAATAPATTLPPLPEPSDEKSDTLDGLVDPLPLFVQDLPDPASQRAAEAYATATLLEPQGAADAFQAAWDALVYPPEARLAVAELGGYLLWGPAEFWSIRDVLHGPSAEATVETHHFRFSSLVDAAMPALAADPRNADRLSNAAVALVALGVASQHGAAEPAVGGLAVGDPGTASQYPYRAVALLQATDRLFGPHRTVLLNLGFFTSLAPSSRWSIDQAIVPVARWLEIDQADRTARLLLGSLQGRQEDAPFALDRAVTTLTPLIEEPATAPLGESALGDVYMAAATFRAVEAPYSAVGLARQALSAYDRALATTDDPGVYAGRATALAFLADHAAFLGDADALPAAVAAQRQAVDLAPRSIELRLELALLLQRVGDVEAMRTAARDALEIVDGGWAPALAHIRYLAEPAESGTIGDRGFLGYSYGSDRDDVVPTWAVGAGAGAFVVGDLGLIPRTNDDPWFADHQRADFAPVVALDLALAASVTLGDVAGAETDIARWEVSAPRSRTGNEMAWTQDSMIGLALPAAALVAGVVPPVDERMVKALTHATGALRRAGRFSDALALCERVNESVAGTDPDLSKEVVNSLAYSLRIQALSCAGETAYHVGHPERAAAALAEAAELTGRHPPYGFFAPLSLLRLRAAAAAWAVGDLDTSRRYFSLTVAESTERLPRLTALAQLGDLAMDMGDPASAAAYYDVILAEVEIAPRDVSVASTEQMLEVDGIRGIGRHALLNRGVARLWQAQEQPGAPPDCATEPQPCLEARDDFAAALAIDGQDPATLINAAWAARLLGDRTQAGDFLAQTVTVDAALAPAWNDLGVLAAQDGNHDHARRAFAVALALDPSYDLPSWNLGILESGRGLPGWLPGQALLARAIAVAPALRTAPPTYAFDDRIYRLVVGAGPGAAEERTIGRAYGFGAAALGSIATLFGVGFILNQHLTGQTAGAITDLGQEPLRRAASTIQAWARRRWTLGVPGRTWRRWQPWLLTLPALAVTTAWTAWQGRGDAGGGALASALLATGIAVVGHELAHRFVARWRGARIGHGSWGPGIGLSLLLLPAGMSSGPYVGQRVRGLTADERWWVYVAGPLASALLAGVALVLFVAQPLPFFRVLAAAHLAVAAYALLPFTPLDGAALSRRHPAAVTALGLVVSTAGLALGLGAL